MALFLGFASISHRLGAFATLFWKLKLFLRPGWITVVRHLFLDTEGISLVSQSIIAAQCIIFWKLEESLLPDGLYNYYRSFSGRVNRRWTEVLSSWNCQCGPSLSADTAGAVST